MICPVRLSRPTATTAVAASALLRALRLALLLLVLFLRPFGSAQESVVPVDDGMCGFIPLQTVVAPFLHPCMDTVGTPGSIHGMPGASVIVPHGISRFFWALRLMRLFALHSLRLLLSSTIWIGFSAWSLASMN